MYLTEANLKEIIINQYRYKFQAYFGIFTSLAFVQILAILFSLGGTSSMGGGSETFSYDIRNYSGSLIAIFTLIWAFTNGLSITTKPYRYDDFNFVTNRRSANYSNILFLITASVIAASTSYFAVHLLNFVVSQIVRIPTTIIEQLTWNDFGSGMIGFYLYTFMFMSLGYFVGMLAQANKLVAIVLPAVFILITILQGFFIGETTFMISVGKFYIMEASLILFSSKAIVTTVLLLFGAVLLSNRLEVRGE